MVLGKVRAKVRERKINGKEFRKLMPNTSQQIFLGNQGTYISFFVEKVVRHFFLSGSVRPTFHRVTHHNLGLGRKGHTGFEGLFA